MNPTNVGFTVTKVAMLVDAFIIEMLELQPCGDIRGLYWDDETQVGPKVFSDYPSAERYAEELLASDGTRKFAGYSIKPFRVRG